MAEYSVGADSKFCKISLRSRACSSGVRFEDMGQGYRSKFRVPRMFTMTSQSLVTAKSRYKHKALAIVKGEAWSGGAMRGVLKKLQLLSDLQE